jgi:hypothetical protein
MAEHTLFGEVLSGHLAEAVAADLADELGVQSAPLRPNGHVCGAASRSQHDLAERVASGQQLTVGADQDIPGEITDDT